MLATLFLDELQVSGIPLLQALSVRERVLCVICAGAARADASKHDNFDFVTS